MAGNEGAQWLLEHNVPIFAQYQSIKLRPMVGKIRLVCRRFTHTSGYSAAELDGGLLPLVMSTEQDAGEYLLMIVSLKVLRNS